MLFSDRSTHLINRILQGLVLAYQGLALVVFVFVPILANRWLKAPFLGAFVEQTLVFNGVGSTHDEVTWALFRQVNLGDQLVAVDGYLVDTTADLGLALESSTAGEHVDLTIASPQGAWRRVPVTLGNFPAIDRLEYLSIPYGVGLVFLAISLWIFGLRRSEPSGRAFALFSTSVAIASAALFDLYTTHVFTLLWTVALGVAAGGLIDLALSFPQTVRLVEKRPILHGVGYMAGLLLASLAVLKLHNLDEPRAYIGYWQSLYLLAGLAVLFFAGMLIYRRLASRSPIVRQQANAILWGMLVAFGPLAIFFLLAAFTPLNFPPLLLVLTIIFPGVTGYSILSHRLVRTDLLLRQGVLYTLLSLLALAGYALLVSGFFLIFGPLFQGENPLFVAALIFLLALAFIPFRNWLQAFIDRTFFRGARAYEQRLRDLSHTLTKIVDLDAILRTLRGHVFESVQPDQLHIFVFDPLDQEYGAADGDDGRPSSDLRFAEGSALPQVLRRGRLPFVYDPATLPPELSADRARLDLLGAILFVPMPGSERLMGWLALGKRLSGEMYKSDDLTFLEQVSTAAAVAIERAQVIFHLEQHVREMNILARIAQGVNVTVAFDDILELIYTQTDQVLPVDEFHITLFNKENDTFFFAFCLEQDDRLRDRENQPLPPGMGLSSDVIRNRRPLMSADYEQECHLRGLLPASAGIRAWLGVPLNTGKETIGALSVGSRDPNVVYTNAQLETMQSIANQAAGAIVKARLLQESEQRARQLTTLNEITRQLTGTLESEPLLEKILQSAVSILNCEAGTLFLVDEQTDELVFRVVNSPVSSTLVGQRLAPGTGIAGQAVKTLQPVMSNNVQQTKNWHPVTDNLTGFVTRTALAVPMQVKERVIGVLEVINRRDGMPFVEDDVNLLASFAGQAAVAIENARLYTLTDQELNDRVEELSVMQRIDRELNASLDVGRAMRITLEWALRQSNSDAGLIGVLEESGMRLTAQQGYNEIEMTYKDKPIPLEQPAFRSAIETGQAQRVSLTDQQPGLLPGALTQTVVPFRREAAVVGLVVLESRSPAPQGGQDMVFLTRLSDHAAIAIANAQLYDEVQAANDAKSEFVSFVAHELKNPMTSIKGYSELLAKGAVGPVNEMQGNFLGTIQSNVERMSTLVSDLNDNSKIEAGRLRLDFKPLDLPVAVEEVMHSTRRQLDEKKQTAVTDIPENLPRLWADPTRLAQILVNLVSNAHKYTPEQGRIIIGAEKAGNRWDPGGAAEVVHIWVKDNGIGISQDDQTRIFQKFFRSDDQKARESPGTGLGLNITRSLVEMMGGRIWFESEYRQGTTFHFTVPVAQD